MEQVDDDRWMRLALEEARRAEALGEVPIGAVIVRDGVLIGRGHNLRELWRDPTAHAEMIALREAAARLGDWRLTGTTCYATIEPCPMCAGALVLARVDRLVYGAPDPKAGACGSVVDIARHERLNHRIEVVSGVLAGEAAGLMKRFFQRLRPGSP